MTFQKLFKFVIILLIITPYFKAQEIEAQEIEKKMPNPNKNHFVKVSLLEFFSGDFSVFYEHSLSKKISVELGAGIVFKNYIKEFVDETPTSTGRKVIPGPSLNAGIRYYPYISGELFYLSADYKYRRYRTRYTTIGNNSEELNFNEYNGKSIYRLGVGYNMSLDGNMFMDFYSGVGFLGNSNKTYFQQINETTSEYDFLYDIQKETKLHFNIGIKISYKL